MAPLPASPRFSGGGTTTKIATGLALTFADFAELWTDKTLHKRHPDHVPDKDEWEDKQLLRDYINPRLGKRRLPDVTLEHAEEVMQALPPHLGPRSRRHIAQCMRKVLSLAVYPGRHIVVNPIPREWMPKIPKSAIKAKSCLFPDEDAKLLSCAAVPLERRVAYGILMREGMRASELSELRWHDVDAKRGRVRLDENKTDDPRAWALSPDIVRVLAWWKKRTGADDEARVLGGLDLTQGPRWLRGKVWDPKTGHKNEVGDLKTAGLDRAELFERTKTRMPVRLHDLRATFVTVSLANGKTEQWVSDRTGHRSSQMLALYTRQARQWNELELGALRPMDTLLPEMAEACLAPAEASPEPVEAHPEPASTAPPPHECGSELVRIGSDCRTRTYDPAVNRRNPESRSYEVAENKADREPRSPEIAHEKRAQRDDGAMGGVTDGDLERGILAAVAAGAFDVAKTLSTQLEDRRRARIPDNLRLLRPTRRGRP